MLNSDQGRKSWLGDLSFGHCVEHRQSRRLICDTDRPPKDGNCFFQAVGSWSQRNRVLDVSQIASEELRHDSWPVLLHFFEDAWPLMVAILSAQRVEIGP